MTARLLIDACGLSHREAAEFLSVRLDTIKSWYRRNPPAARQGVINELAELHARQRRAAAHLIRQVRTLVTEHGAADRIEIGLASDDAGARSIGWPCVGAQRMAIALAAARLTQARVVIVPRGTTLATVAAIESANTKNPGTTPEQVPNSFPVRLRGLA